MLSLGPEQIMGELLLGTMGSMSELMSEGKSGSFFYYSNDALCAALPPPSPLPRPVSASTAPSPSPRPTPSPRLLAQPATWRPTDTPARKHAHTPTREHSRRSRLPVAGT